MLGSVIREFIVKTDKTHGCVPGKLTPLESPKEAPYICVTTLVQYVENQLKFHHGMEVSKAHITNAIKHLYEKNPVSQFYPTAGRDGRSLGKFQAWADKESKTSAQRLGHFRVNPTLSTRYISQTFQSL